MTGKISMVIKKSDSEAVYQVPISMWNNLIPNATYSHYFVDQAMKTLTIFVIQNYMTALEKGTIE